MHRSIRVALATLLFGSLVPLTVLASPPAQAEPQPAFKVVCVPQKMAKNDPIVFPGQPGRSHMHTFYGARKVPAGATVKSLLAGPRSACGAGFAGADRSAYWIPTLYKRGKPVYSKKGRLELAVYYERAGGAKGARIKQAFPRGLRMIAGDMHSTKPQHNVWYKCAVTKESGRQSKLSRRFPSCRSNETLISELVFPDCWDGKRLDSPNHKAHMRFSRGKRARCPKSHPVKLPQVTFEAWHHGVNGRAKAFRLASGSAYTMHGDIMSAWRPRAFARLVNRCLNVARDCTPLRLDQIGRSSVREAQVDAQLAVAPERATPAVATPVPAGHDHAGSDQSEDIVPAADTDRGGRSAHSHGVTTTVTTELSTATRAERVNVAAARQSEGVTQDPIRLAALAITGATVLLGGFVALMWGGGLRSRAGSRR
ncbi:DUF1996 domain-containing protein [Mumia sp. DW29H23]|uniref:DUF1996 domain-containing protein n=1 Tax=Mumia sp. DW29H23 TaxID=3421241 RepID=UPI003D69A65D